MKKQSIPKEADFQHAVSGYATETRRLEKLKANLEAAVTAAHEKYRDEITEITNFIEVKEDVITRYAEARRESLLPADGKTVRFGNVEMGWRTGQPKLEPCDDLSWEEVTAMIKKKLPHCIRVKEELNKVLVKQLVAIPGKEAKLINACGLQLVQEEAFFLNVKEA